MVPSFNTAGPCIPGEHYMLPPVRRIGRVLQLIDERKYFTLQSGRQTGKTTSAQWLAEHYNAGDRYRAMWVDVQGAREEPDPAAAFLTVVEALDHAVRTWLGDVGIPAAAVRSLENPSTVILRYLRDLSARCPRPLVVLIDALVGPAMVSFLTQLRDGYLARSKAPFPRQMQIANEPADYVRADGALDLAKLMDDWQLFWREDGHLAAAGFSYRESGPHLRAKRTWKQRLASKTVKTAGKRIHLIGC